MAKTTHENKGHCQACGRIQAVDNSTKKIAKHGYKVSGFGFFSGTCIGSDQPALQLSRFFLDQTVVNLDVYAAAQIALAARMEAGEAHPALVRTDIEVRDAEDKLVRDRMGRRTYVMLNWEDANGVQRATALANAISGAKNEARQARAHAKELELLAKTVFGTALIANKALTKPAPVAVQPGLKWTDANGELEVVKFAGYWGMGQTARYEVRRADGHTYRDSVQGIRNSIKRAQASA